VVVGETKRRGIEFRRSSLDHDPVLVDRDIAHHVARIHARLDELERETVQLLACGALLLVRDRLGQSTLAFGVSATDPPTFIVMTAVLAVVALVTARTIERSQLGFGFATIRDDELAAEACGVPTLRLKLIATTLSGAFMGMAGAPFPYYIGYLQPASAFGLEYAVNSIAMPMIGGTTSWVGPLVGAVLLGSAQQYATVTISSAANLLIVGLMLVSFVIIAPNGLVGLVQGWRRSWRKP